MRKRCVQTWARRQNRVQNHFDDPATFVREARRVIRAGGALAIVGMDPQTEPDEWYLYDSFPGTRDTDRGRYPSGDMILHWMETAGFVRCERRLAARIEHDAFGSQVLNDPILQKNGTSQLALLTESAFERGMARIREAIRLAEGGSEEIVFRTRIALPVVIGVVSSTTGTRQAAHGYEVLRGSPCRDGSKSEVRSRRHGNGEIGQNRPGGFKGRDGRHPAHPA